MNKVILMGRLTRDPEVRYSQGDKPTAIARFTLAVNRRTRREGDPDADFINCVAFGRNGEFAEKYLRQGTKIAVTGRIQTGSYTNRDGQKVFTTEVVIEEQEFAESKGNGTPSNNGGNTNANRGASNNANGQVPEGYSAGYGAGYSGTDIGDGFMNIPDGIDEELPFS